MRILFSILLFFCCLSSFGNTDSLKRTKPKSALIEQLTRKPVFPYSLNDYLMKNLKYPRVARECNIEGWVRVQFLMDENGKVCDAKVISMPQGGGLEEEALRLVKSLPKGAYTPGRYGKKPVRVVYELPIRFKLE